LIYFIVDESRGFEVKYNANQFRISTYKMFMKKYPGIPLHLISRKGDRDVIDERVKQWVF